MYRAEHVTQRDGSKLEAFNCRMAVGSTQLDFHTRGVKLSTGAKMRRYQSDQKGGTDPGDLLRAWRDGYSETLTIRWSGWDRLLADLAMGRMVAVDVWYALIPRSDRCQDNGNIGHTIGIAPEPINDSGMVVSDPLCDSWQRVQPADIRRAAEEWARRIEGGSTRKTGFRLPFRGSPEAEERPESPVFGPSGTVPHPLDTGGAGGEYFRPISYTTSDSGDDMQSFVWLPGPAGRITVKSGPATRYLRLRDGKLIEPEPGMTRDAIPVRLLQPIPGGLPGADRQTGYLFRATEAKFLLSGDVTFSPYAEDCGQEVAAERKRWTDWLDGAPEAP